MTLLSATALEGRVARADDATPAARLFDEGMDLMDHGQWAEACAKLEESLRLELKGGTLINLASCREKEGKTATALARYNEALGAARRDGRSDRERAALAAITNLTRKLSWLTIAVSDAARAVPGLEVKRDDEIVATAQWGIAVAVDPGKHTLTASAPGMKPWEQGAEISRQGASVTVTVPPLESIGIAVVPDASPSGAPSAEHFPSEEPVPPPEDNGARRTFRAAALITGGVGLVGIVLGSVYGGIAISQKNQSEKSCPGGSVGPCFADGVAESKDAVSNGNISTVAFSVGAAAVAGAVVLWVVAPKARAQATSVRVFPTLGVGTAGLTVAGGF